MAELVAVAGDASRLSGRLFDAAHDASYPEKERNAFRSDAMIVVAATQAFAISPAYGNASPKYDATANELREAHTAFSAATPGDASAIHLARIEIVQAVRAMQEATAKPAVAVS